MPRLEQETTTDALLEGALFLRQPRRGYRVNVDTLLLAAFAARDRRARLVVDLGAGVGALALSLAVVGAAVAVALVEEDHALLDLSRDNLARNGVTGSIHSADLARGLPPELAQRADLVVCNPPFFPPARGTPARDGAARRARSGAIDPFLHAAQAALAGPRGRAAFCYPAAALPELLAAGRAAGLVPKRLRLVHARVDDPARLALVELRMAKPGGLVVEPPLVEWSGRARSRDVAAIVAGRFGPAR